MAGSVTPQKAEIVAGPAIRLILAFLTLSQMARAPPPWAIMVAETIALSGEDASGPAICWEMIGMTAQCRPKMTRHW